MGNGALWNRILSFNLLNVGKYSKKEYKTIVKIIDDSKAGIVVLQEIYHQAPVDIIVKALGNDKWMGRFDYSVHSSKSEGYAILWNTSAVKLVTNRYGQPFYPRIIYQYKLDRSIYVDRLIRNPMWGRFIPIVDPAAEIRIITTHIVFSANREEDTQDEIIRTFANAKELNTRKSEFHVLSEVILPKYSDKTYDHYDQNGGLNPDAAYTVLIGDYNLNLQKPGEIRDNTLEENEALIVIDGPQKYREICTVQDELTTLKKPKNNEPIDGLANNYDHLTYDRMRFEYSPNVRVIDVVNDPRYGFNGNYDKYKKEISDHLPILVDIHLKK